MSGLRMGLVGLGMMGRHHARILGGLEGVKFIGAVDPGGDRHRSLLRGELFGTLEELVGAGVQAVVVAVPTEDHEAVALGLAEAGVHALVEKPLAADSAGAERIRRAFEEADLVGAVGHVERFNPALQELHRRMAEGQLGRVFSIVTERVGPFPHRVRDVGVVKDLATHDIDLVGWLGGAPVKTISGQTAHQMGRPHEDLVEAVGRLSTGVVVRMSVNWLTPTKRRQVTVLGEGGALVADMISADLTYFANADMPTEWEAVARLRGVSEGDMVRYALRKREPLMVELEHFRDAVLGRPGAQTVSLEEGVEVLRVAEAILVSAELGEILEVGRT